MKKVTCFLIMLALIPAAMAQSGKLSVRMHGIVCHQQTADNILGMDGVGDEIYLWFYHANNSGPNTVAPVRNIGSPTFAEKNSFMSSSDFYAREKAGTASVNGGLKTGDTYIINGLRYIIDKQQITPSSVVFICPSIWEYDKDAEYPPPSAAYINTTKDVTGTIFFQDQVRNALANFNYNGIDNYNYMLAGRNLGLDNHYVNIFKPFAGKQCSRPIGMNANHEFNSIVIALNSRIASILATKDYGYGQGIVPVLYSDVSLGNNANHGVYSILLKFEFIADPFVPAPPPPPASTAPNNTQTPTTPITVNATPIKNTQMSSLNSIAATWAGTYGTGTSNSPNFYSFKLNADGSMQLLDANGAAIANGSYQFANNQLTGSYNYTNNKSTYSFAATLSGTQLNGTWGSGTNTSNGGKWIMNRSGTQLVNTIR